MKLNRTSTDENFKNDCIEANDGKSSCIDHGV